MFTPSEDASSVAEVTINSMESIINIRNQLKQPVWIHLYANQNDNQSFRELIEELAESANVSDVLKSLVFNQTVVRI